MAFLDETTVKSFYKGYAARLAAVRGKVKRPLTYAEKLLYTHMQAAEACARGKDTLTLAVDRVAMQDATAQMVVLQFMLAGKKTVAVPTTVHCDHLIAARQGASEDLQEALLANDEVYRFLKSAAARYGMGFWKPGAGIIHQVVLENYAVPGQLMIGTDSHTPNAGGLGMLAIGVGGADAVEAMAGLPWKVRAPLLIGVQLKGKLHGWAAPKDIILKVAERLTVKGGTGAVIEYFGEGARALSATGKATITNMGAEVGATTSVFPYDDRTAAYLAATRRGFVAKEAEKVRADLQADSAVEKDPDRYFDLVITIDLDTLKPLVVGPHTPDLARPAGRLGDEARKKGWPTELKYTLIGSCTNSSYEDMTRAASIARQAVVKGLKLKAPLLVTPGSDQIHRTIRRDGLLDVFEKLGATVLANACGPCIGQWRRTDVTTGEKNSIITSYNRNFRKRNDANPETHAFIASPEVVVAYALAGTLDSDPLEELQLKPPVAEELPKEGFVFADEGFEAPTGKGEVAIPKGSERLAFLQPFPKWNLTKDFSGLLVLAKATGKCTTDHISPAGKWLRFRGHLDRISDNLFSGVENAFSDEPGTGTDVLTDKAGTLSAIARAYHQERKGWVMVGEENYGEGSSREHAAMEPRYFGCRAVLAKGFARIHETNLKKQGVLALTFANPSDYDRIKQDSKITIKTEELAVGKPVTVVCDGKSFPAKHSLTGEELEWFRAGGLLNWFRDQ